MLWLGRPPYLRRALAIGLVLLAMAVEFWPTPTVRHPHARESIAAGTMVSRDDLDWRSIPAGILRPVQLPAVAMVDIEPGEPVTRTLLGDTIAAPSGWWTVEMSLPEMATPGRALRLFLLSPHDGTETAGVPGIVVSSASESSFSDFGGNGLVAVPESAASAVATALSEDRLVVMMGTDGPDDR